MVRLRGILAIARALRLRQNDTSHTMQHIIKTRELRATSARIGGMNLAIDSRDCEVSSERLEPSERAAPERPT